MNLETQISLISNPQEFMRLCNAVLTSEYSDDFLPIADDQPDRGNDGYLKSEKRLFAAHCFKKVHKQSLNKEILAKMIGDLGKAIALKRGHIWEIEAWTFISNYTIPETVAAKVLRTGKEADVDVSWRGPDFLAKTLGKDKKIRQQFPDLFLSEVGDELKKISTAIKKPRAKKPPVKIPANSEEQRYLISTRPGGWEYLLFAGVLLQGKNRLELKWHDHELRIPIDTREKFDLKEASHWLSEEFSWLTTHIDYLMRSFDEKHQEQAFGLPGAPGDPSRIEHFARRIIIFYENLLDWSARVRGVEPVEELKNSFEIAARMSDLPLQQVRDFIDKTVSEVGKVPDYLANKDKKKQPLRIELTLVLSVDDSLVKEFKKTLKKAKRKISWGF